MRYITEFEISPDIVFREKDIARRVEYAKRDRSFELGELIAKHIGFEEITPLKKYRLEIQAFSQKDWLHFKQTLKQYIESTQGSLSTFNLIMIGKMLKELEDKMPNNEQNPERSVATEDQSRNK